jgi:anti-anti-sigma factor
MTLERHDRGDAVIISLSGHLDALTSAEIGEQIRSFIDNGDTRMILDLEKLEYISSAGLQILLQAAKKTASLNGFLALVKIAPEVMEVLDIAGFSSFLNIYESVDKALLKLAP